MKRETSRTEDYLRGNFYSLLARMLAKPPDEDLLERLRRIPPVESAGQGLAAGWKGLRDSAFLTEPEFEIEEYQRLFHGLNGKTLAPYASRYETGLLFDKPLARIREDLRRLGIERVAGIREPEDHAAALFEVMAMLCRNPGDAAEEQAKFFNTHLAPWIGRFFSDLAEAAETDFYKALGHIGLEFCHFENGYLGLPSGMRGGHFIPKESDNCERRCHESNQTAEK